MLKTKKSKFKVATILTIAVLLCLYPLLGVFMRLAFGFEKIKNHTIDGDVDVSVSMNLRFDSSVFSPVTYHYSVEFDFTYNTSVTAVEIERINYQIYRGSRNIYTYNGTYWQHSGSTALSFGSNLTCQGFVDLNYQLNSNPQNSTVNYNLVYTNSIRIQDVQSIVIFKNAIFIFYNLSFFLLPIILFFTIHPDFYEPSKEEIEKGEEYFDYLEKMKPKENK